MSGPQKERVHLCGHVLGGPENRAGSKLRTAEAKTKAEDHGVHSAIQQKQSHRRRTQVSTADRPALSPRVASSTVFF